MATTPYAGFVTISAAERFVLGRLSVPRERDREQNYHKEESMPHTPFDVRDRRPINWTSQHRVLPSCSGQRCDRILPAKQSLISRRRLSESARCLKRSERFSTICHSRSPARAP